MAKQKCPSVTALRLFNEGQLPPVDIELIGSHLEECEKCVSLLDELDPGSLVQGMVDAVVDDRPEGDVSQIEQDVQLILDKITPEDSPTIQSCNGCDLYSLESLVGKTRFGDKYKAVDLVMERPVTVIVANGSSIASVDHRSQFIQDASFASSLRHENILHINQYGPWDDDHCYIAMPELLSVSLDQILESGQSFSLSAVLTVIGQVCQALRFAHRHNIVHRHLSPKTIFVSEELHVLVTEFGLALDGRYQFELLQPLPTTTKYDSIEAKYNDPARIDIRTDIFSVGALIDSLLEHVTDVDEEATARLRRIARKCQRVSRRRRFQTVTELTEAIGRLLSD